MSGTPPHQGRIANIANTAQSYSQMAVIFAGNNNSDRKKSSQEELNRVLTALFLSDPYVDRKTIIAAKGPRVPGTCEWILHDEKYSAWLNDGSNGDKCDKSKTNVLWISGGPGTGKTMLSIFLTEELERYTAPIDNADVIFFFCNSHDCRKSSASSLLRGLIYQIISKRPQLVKHAIPYFAEEATHQTLSSIEKLWEIFSKLITDADLGTMFCVLDGLDELDEGDNIITEPVLPEIVNLLRKKTLSSANNSARFTFRLLIISRNMQGLEGVPRIRLEFNVDRSRNDIELFISTRLAELSWIQGFENIREFVSKASMEYSAWSFLKAAHMINQMSRVTTCSEVLEVLQTPTYSLSETYDRVLLQIPSTSEGISRNILKWVTFAARPLQLLELAAAVDTRISDRMTIEMMLFPFKPLLEIREQKVTLAHQSVRDYLPCEQPDSGRVQETFRLKSLSSNLEIAKACLDCIAEDHLDPVTVDITTKSTLERSPLLGYAVDYWPLHAAQCAALAPLLFDHAQYFFQERSSLRDHWWRAYSGKGSSGRSALYMACSTGVIRWVEWILSRKSAKKTSYHQHTDEETDDNQVTQEVLKAAAGNKNNGEEVTRFLLGSQGHDILIKEEVLKVAAGNTARGAEVMRLLLDQQGHEIQITEEVMKAAARNRVTGEEVVRLLLDLHRDDIYITEEVLKIAVRNEGSGQKIMELFLERRGEEIQITEDILKAAARNEWHGYDLMKLFVSNRDEIRITKELRDIAAKNKVNGHIIEKFLLVHQLRNIERDTWKLEKLAQSLSSEWTNDHDLHMATSTIFSSLQEKVTEATSVSNPYEISALQPGKKVLEENDNASIISKDTIDMTREQDDELIDNFTDALYKSTHESIFPFHRSNVSSDALLKAKIKKFGQRVKEDNPRDKNEFKPKRKVAKAIQRLSQHILTQFAQRLLSNDLPSSGAQLEAISERPFSELNIPSESMEQKLQRLEITDIENDATLFNTSHDREDGLESVGSSDSDSSVVHTRPDFASIHEYFKTHPAFEVLTSDIQRSMKHFHYDALKHIRQSVYEGTEKTSNSIQLSEKVYNAQFHADWDLLCFLEERRSYGLNDDLGSVLTITGNSQQAQLETVASFIRQTWEAHFDVLLPVFQEAISGPQLSSSGKESSNIRIHIGSGTVWVSVTGSKGFLTAVAQQLAWLGATCRPCKQGLPSEAHPNPSYHDTIWDVEDSKPKTFRISYVTVPVDEDEPSPSWTSLFNGPCIASGYPISARSENQVGLQLPQEFLGISEPVSGQLTRQGKKSAESSGQFFIPGEPNCNLERILQISGQTKNLMSLEEEVNSTRSIFQYFRRSLVGLKRRYEQSDVERYGLKSSKRLSHVVAEILDADPGSVEWSSKDPISFFDTFKNKFEDWTREEWDWWPLKPPKRALRSNEARLYWTSICGERRWAETPEDFAKMTTEIAKACALRIERFAHCASGQSPAATPSQPPPPSANTSSSNTTQTSTKNAQKIIGPSSPSNNINLGTTTSTMNSPSSLLTPQHIFLVVASGNDIRLAQIRVENLTTDRFFHELREQNNRL